MFVAEWHHVVIMAREVRHWLRQTAAGPAGVLTGAKGIALASMNLWVDTGNTIALGAVILLYGFFLPAMAVGMPVIAVDLFRPGTQQRFFDRFGNLFVISTSIFAFGFWVYHLLLSEHFWAGQLYANKIILSFFGWPLAAFITYLLHASKTESDPRSSIFDPSQIVTREAVLLVAYNVPAKHVFSMLDRVSHDSLPSTKAGPVLIGYGIVDVHGLAAYVLSFRPDLSQADKDTVILRLQQEPSLPHRVFQQRAPVTILPSEIRSTWPEVTASDPFR